MSETITDSHCHLDYFSEEEVEAVVGRAREAGVGRMITIGTRIAQTEAVRGLIERFPDVWGTVGVHPLSIHEVPMPEEAEIAAAADHPRVVGIGETGLDYHYAAEHAAIQAESFRRHIRVARRLGLPVVVHTRAADEDTARILREERESGGAFDVLLHCFSSGRALAEEVVADGGYVSFSGILTFPKSQDIRDVARDLPADRLLVETDAPYLAPAPFRGKRCEPAYVMHTARKLAEVRGMSLEELAALTTGNVRRLFKKIA
ncbi:MAG: LuxR family transcriptional regulator [Azospirillum brasilense]|nr:MAG: LuxR family transcriptional regulator [Azospirillum brasilense]